MDFPGLPERYCITSKLGTGSFATVWNAIDLETNSTVAVKVIPHDPGNRTVCEERIANELHINQVVHHKHIANLLDHYEDDKNSYLINELCCKGTLGDLVLELGMIPENELRKYFIKILKVLKYLHEEVHIIHRDIKIDNIMFDAKNTLKLIDFGLSIEHYPGDPGLTKCCGSPKYVAPEMFFGEEYDECVDIWALGVVLFYCTAGYFPFESYVLQKLSYKIMFEEPLYPMTASDELLDLLQKLLNKEPEERIKLNEIFEHEWVKMGSTSGQAAEEAKAKGEILTEIGDEENIENKLTTEIKNETNEENIDNESKTDEKRENRTPSPKRGIPSIPRLPGRKEGVGNKPTPPRPEKSFKPQHNREVMRRKQRILTGSSYDLGNFAPTNGSQSNIRRRSRMNDSFDNVAELMSSQSSHLCDSMPYGTVFG